MNPLQLRENFPFPFPFAIIVNHLLSSVAVQSPRGCYMLVLIWPEYLVFKVVREFYLIFSLYTFAFFDLGFWVDRLLIIIYKIATAGEQFNY